MTINCRISGDICMKKSGVNHERSGEGAGKREKVMKIKTTRFGEIDVREEEFIVMKGSILGFEHLKRFVLLQNSEKTPLWWLQSVDEPAAAFVVVNPLIIKPDYAPAFAPGDLEMVDIKDGKDIAMLSIVTVRSQPLRVTANLRAPILINSGNRTASQVVLEDASHQIRYDLADAGESEGMARPGNPAPSAPAMPTTAHGER